jgi:hypothetical protein
MDAGAAVVQTESRPLAVGIGGNPIMDGQSVEIAKRLNAVKNVDVIPIVREQEQAVWRDLKQLGFDGKPQEALEVLVKQLSVIKLSLAAETTYRVIFGSQIRLLRFLNLYGPQLSGRVHQFYESAREKFPLLYESYSFEKYVEYLVTNLLISKGQDGNIYSITAAGREFLKWMTDMSVTEEKFG